LIMEKIKFAAVFLVIVLIMAAGASWADEVCSEPVMTVSGPVRGKDDPGSYTCVWKGIPFAAPPVGELRWQAPQPAPAWEGVRDAYEYGSPCMQVPASDHMSEDCLYLNIWRPRKSGVFPVMLWIHGGGYIMGSGDIYVGTSLAEFGDVVVVTTNYRLHAFGFLAHPSFREEDPNHSTGSYGSLDQVAAIKWVHDNIAAFGGDPGNVTIFGESAGGWSICTMLATPLNRGMIHRAILESGSCKKSKDIEEGYVQTRSIAKRVGCEPEPRSP
jgi:para-nitrobenzyl esterase